MNLRKTLLTLAGLAAFTVAGTAKAIVVTVEDNIAGTRYIQAGQSVTGTFDIEPALPNNGLYTVPYNVNSGTATFSFADDGDARYYGTSYATWMLTSQGHHYRNMIRNSYDLIRDDYEGVQLIMNSQVSADGTNWYTAQALDYTRTWSAQTGRTRHSYTYSCGTWGTGTCTGYYYHNVYTYYTENNYDQTSGYTGQFTITSQLDPTNLEDLSLDGKVDFTVRGISGDLYYTSGSLTADVSPTVPEPGTLLLLGSGLLAGFGVTGLSRRRRERKPV